MKPTNTLFPTVLSSLTAASPDHTHLFSINDSLPLSSSVVWHLCPATLFLPNAHTYKTPSVNPYRKSVSYVKAGVCACVWVWHCSQCDDCLCSQGLTFVLSNSVTKIWPESISVCACVCVCRPLAEWTECVWLHDGLSGQLNFVCVCARVCVCDRDLTDDVISQINYML